MEIFEIAKISSEGTMDVIASDSQQNKVSCLLCNGLITLVEEEDRFALHMKSLHDVFYNLEFLLAACHMDEDEKDAVIGVMKVKTGKIQDSSELKTESTEEDNTVTLFNEENNLIMKDIKIKKVTVDVVARGILIFSDVFGMHSYFWDTK